MSSLVPLPFPLLPCPISLSTFSVAIHNLFPQSALSGSWAEAHHPLSTLPWQPPPPLTTLSLSGVACRVPLKAAAAGRAAFPSKWVVRALIWSPQGERTPPRPTRQTLEGLVCFGFPAARCYCSLWGVPPGCSLASIVLWPCFTVVFFVLFIVFSSFSLFRSHMFSNLFRSRVFGKMFS